jgi:hypothetical protein
MGMPHPLQLTLFALEFSDVIEFRAPPPACGRISRHAAWSTFGKYAAVSNW